MLVEDLALTDQQRPDQQQQAQTAKRPYEKPELVVHGTVGDLTQSGGNRQHDGVFTRKLS
jgi:hypothetical protein